MQSIATCKVFLAGSIGSTTNVFSPHNTVALSHPFIGGEMHSLCSCANCSLFPSMAPVSHPWGSGGFLQTPHIERIAPLFK